MEIPMARLTDTQLVILSTASRRHDRGVDLPTNVTGEALRKAVDKLIRTGLLEEVRANGSLLAWRRDAEAGPMALRITQQGLEAIGVKDVAVSAPTETMRGFFAGVVRKKLGLELRSEKVDGDRVYRIVHSSTARSASRPSRRRAA